MKQVAAGSSAAKEDVVAKASLKGKSKGYVKGYRETYNSKLAKHARYIYNTQAINFYNSPDFTTEGLVGKQRKVPTSELKAFKVNKILVSKSGLVRYYVKNSLVPDGKAYVTANHSYVVSAYYQTPDLKQNQKTVKVVSSKGVYLHSAKKYTYDNRGQYFKQGKKLKITRVTEYKGITRFYVGHDKYLTSNKKYVKYI
ncbi:DUF5776 domain-containing protein [Lactobacillaceae bacterium Scapto_B20]